MKYFSCFRLWQKEKQYYDDNATEGLSHVDNRLNDFEIPIQLSNEHNSKEKGEV